MIALLQVLVALCAGVAALGLLALVQIALFVLHDIRSLGANMTAGETPERLGAPGAARGSAPRLPPVSEDRTRVDERVHSEPVAAVAPEVRRASATVQLGWDHATQRPTMTVHPEPIEASRGA